MDIAKLIKAITHTMQCDKCPYPCKAKENGSQANCDKHWFDLLTNIDTIVAFEATTWDEIRDKLLET